MEKKLNTSKSETITYISLPVLYILCFLQQIIKRLLRTEMKSGPDLQESSEYNTKMSLEKSRLNIYPWILLAEKLTLTEHYPKEKWN